ncbi:hypothetical protein ACIGXM_11615 [Kitasatospora sp. NPDC052896]|uniref:hypothetical protein n=1 Tax=Kitasatospora sp. NPDC052896 TaxID=3364061 RepID=UPI0037C61ADA
MSDSAGTSPASAPRGGFSKVLLHPVGAVTSAVRQVPGASVVKEVFDGVLDTVGVVSPRTRRVAAYAGAGLLGAAGLVEWPVVVAGAAVVWLTQPRARSGESTAAQPARKPAAKARADRPRTKSATGTAKAAKPRTTKPRTTKPSAAKSTARSTGTRATASTTGRRATGARQS